MSKIVLYLHGRSVDDKDERWVEAIRHGFRGRESLDQRGYTTVTPTYLDLFNAPRPFGTEMPEPPTRQAPPQAELQKLHGDYLRRAARLQTRLSRDEDASLLGYVPQPVADPAAAVMVKRFMKDVENYRSERSRRHAVLARILDALPHDADDVWIIAHSLGSVVAVDLLYYLPSSVQVRGLVTIGSPLSLKPTREHLRRAREKFPYDIVRSWLNLVAPEDFVTGGRGASAWFPEATDRFVRGDGHAARGYLEDDTAARWIDAVDDEFDSDGRGSGNPSSLPTETVPQALITILADFQFALRLEQSEKDLSRRRRMGLARQLMCDQIALDLAAAEGTFPESIVHRLGRDNAVLLASWLEPLAKAQFLTRVVANGGNFAPYDIKVSDDLERQATQRLVDDLEIPETWAPLIKSTMKSIEKALKDGPLDGWELSDLWMGLAVVGGVAAAASLPFLIPVIAPAGLAGASAITAGLAAFGPGGMAGGISLLGLVGAAGGAVATRAASELLAGSPAEVERALALLCLNASVRRDLHLDPSDHPAYPEYAFMTQMESRAATELARHREISERGSKAVKNSEKKLIVVGRAIDWMKGKGLVGSDPARAAIAKSDRQLEA